jgi:hypothetical protein
MTAMERARGRYMRAPDHPGGDGGSGGGGDSSSGDSSAAGDNGEGTDTAAALEKEFGGDAGDGAADDDGGEDLGSHYDGDDSDGDGDQDGDGDGDGDDSGDGDEDADGDGNPDRTQIRFNELTAARREAERKLAEAERQAEYWRNEAQKAPPASQPKEGEEDPYAAPDPAKFEFGEADAKYIAALAVHEAMTQVRAEGDRARISAELNELEAKYQGNVVKALEKYADYDEVVTKGAEGETPKWKCSPIVALGIRHSDHGVDVAYHLAKNPTEADRIYGLSNLEQAREFGKLEGRFMRDHELAEANKQQGGGNNNAPPRKQSSAPKPPKGQSRGSGGKFTVPADTDDFRAFDKQYGNGPRR